jgi:hypothetical protein
MLRLVVVAAAIEVLLRTRPLPDVARRLGVAFVAVDVDVDAAGSIAAPVMLTEGERRRLRWARRIGRRWPFCEGTCLRESLLAGYVLRRHHPRLVIGVSRKGDSFAAHAWLDVQGRMVGDPGRFQRLA